MTIPYQGIQFGTATGLTPYTDDRGTNHSFTTRFRLTPDMTPAQATAIANATGGNAVAIGSQIGAVKNYCPTPGVKPRKIKFIRSDGSSISVAIPTHVGIVTTGTAILTAINAVSAARPVVCAELEGEYFKGLFDVLATQPAPARVPGVSSRPTAGGKQLFYTGAMDYLSDAVYGGSYKAKFKIASQTLAAPTEYAAIIAVADVIGTNVNCPFSGTRKPRRYHVTSLVTQGASTVSQKVDIPVNNHLSTQILAVGQLIANATSTLCLEYSGEDNRQLLALL